jgi:geranylgeranyl pyrophosphate synthase
MVTLLEIFVDKKEIVKQVIGKLNLDKEIQIILELVSKSPSAPEKALSELHRLSKMDYDTADFKEIFRAIEKKGYINQTNKNVWETIYGKFGLNYPIDQKER